MNFRPLRKIVTGTLMNFQPLRKNATHMNFQPMRKIVTHMNIFYPGISGEKIEIDPVGTKGSVKFLRQKAATYPADTIASADIIEEKNGEPYFGFYFQIDEQFWMIGYYLVFWI